MLKKSQPKLAEVQRAFEAWRQSGRTRITPRELRIQALNLLGEYRISDVMKALHVDHRRLSRWREELSASETGLAANAFVELPAAAKPTLEAPSSSVAMTLTRQAGDGSTLSIQAELSEVQWRWAVGLLQEAVS